MADLTPMLRQYMGVKESHPDAIVFFRLGDFYEMFFEDARIASKILGITLTSRGTYQGEKVPMCGVPYHSARSYIARLVDSGWKVALCEQVEDPRTSRGIVKREVIRVVTPGSIVDEREVDAKSNLYMAALTEQEGCFGLACVDLSTGEFRVTESDSLEKILEELGRIAPEELILPQGTDLLGSAPYRIEHLEPEVFDPGEAQRLLKEHLQVRSLAAFGCEEMVQGTAAAGALVQYLKSIQKQWPVHIREVSTYRLQDSMFLDEATRSHLEILRTMRRQSVKGSLLHVLDKTHTPMGSRLLRKWLCYPLIRLEEIRRRHAAVQCLKDDPFLRHELREALNGVYDLERLNGRLALGRANARDLLALKGSLDRLPGIKERLLPSPSALLAEMGEQMDPLEDVAGWIGEAVADDPPVGVKEGGMIREGYDPELDELIAASRDGKGWIARFAAQEQQRTGISSLKVGFNKVYGYYIEVTRPNLGLVPPDYIRKQTVANGERFITEPLKKKEEQVLRAEELRVEREYLLFERLCGRINEQNARIKKAAHQVAVLDVLAALAEAAEAYGYVCPRMTEDPELFIRDGRHPVVEQTVRDEEFVPNDIRLDPHDQQLLIITGPNMAGKSTILRQSALAVLMAQAGSFVPAAEAVIGIADRIFTRVGASDDLARGQSTFMVEMTETAHILRHCTLRSLVILDEIGRGTSTFDGLSIAWAVAEALHDRGGVGVRTLFATHYHELTELVATKPRVKNFHIAVREWKDRIIFLRKLVPGATSRSYGIQVARIAGLPEGVLQRAKEILENLERKEFDAQGRPRLARGRPSGRKEPGMVQLTLFRPADQKLQEWIRGLDLLSMTPLEALLELQRLKEYVEGDT